MGPFLVGWTAMMAAMMLPSAMPMVLLQHVRVSSNGILTPVRTGLFVGTYLALWGLVGIPVWLLMPVIAMVPFQSRTMLIAAVLLAAGMYQFSPLKTACLRVCRSPMDFLLTHWYRGVVGELRLGIEHALYCLGCCWVLMAVFVIAGAMGLVWAAMIALVVFVEKLMPSGITFSRVIGTVLILGAATVAVRPDLVRFIGAGM